MKKLTAILLVCLMLFALCACGKDAEPAENGGQMVNPMVEVDETELCNAIGVALSAPEGAENIKFFIIGSVLGEVQFDYESTHYNYRVQKTDELEDISGLYFSKAFTTDSNLGCGIMVEEDGSMGAATWYADGFSYAISIGEGASAKLLEDMYLLLTA